MTRFSEWRRMHRLLRAYYAMRGIAEYHQKQGHDVLFIGVNEGFLVLRCYTCDPTQSKSLL